MSEWLEVMKRAQSSIDLHQFADAKQILAPLTSHEDEKCKLTAMRKIAICDFYLEDYDAALKSFEKIYEISKETADVMNVFRVAVEMENFAAVKRSYDQAISDIKKDIQNGNEPFLTPVNLKCYYLDAHARLQKIGEGELLIQELLSFYQSVETLEENYLYEGDVPLFISFLEATKDYYISAGKEPEFEGWANKQLEWVDDHGKIAIEEVLNPESE